MKRYLPQIRMIGTKDAPWIMPLFGSPCESESQAESIAAWIAKQWLGVAESRAVEAESSENEAKRNVASFKQCGESLTIKCTDGPPKFVTEIDSSALPLLHEYAKPKRKRVAKPKVKAESSPKPCATTSHLRLISALNQRADDLIEQAEMDREYRENMWRNHDCDPEPESFERGMTLEEALQYRYEREMESRS